MDLLHPVVDDLWGRPSLAHHVQPDLGSDTRAALSSLQEVVAEYWPSPLHLAPPDALHVTIYALVPVKGGFDKGAYWDRISEPSKVLIAEHCSGRDAFELQFFGLKVTDAAIVAVARDETGLIDALRRRIAEDIPPPPGSQPLRYDLIHSTLARHRSPMPVPLSTVRRVEDLPVDIRAPVDRLKIVRESQFPCLATEELASFPLARR